jgi:hypothetical protein
MKFPKTEKNIVENISPFIAEQIIKMVDDEDYSPEYICKFAFDQWPQLGITVPNPFIGGVLIRKSREITNRINERKNNTNR